MNLQNIKKAKGEKGFTIVELLIVIVVIGILAAIVIVAYVGVTRNANTSKARSNATSVQKVAEVINADTGNYPTTGTAFTTGSSTTKLPTGVTVVRPAGTDLASLRTAVANTGGTSGTFIPADNFDTIGVSTVSGGGGVIFYRDGSNAIQQIYYGAGASNSTFAQLGS